MQLSSQFKCCQWYLHLNSQNIAISYVPSLTLSLSTQGRPRLISPRYNFFILELPLSCFSHLSLSHGLHTSLWGHLRWKNQISGIVRQCRNMRRGKHGCFLAKRAQTVFYNQKLNFVPSFECCCCEQPISSQKFFLLQFHWMLTTTTFET